MLKTVKLSITLPSDLVQEVRSLTNEDTSLSSAIRDLLLQALTGELGDDGEEKGSRLATLEEEFTLLKSELKEVKLSILTEKIRKGQSARVTRSKQGYVDLEGDVLVQVMDRLALMQAAGLNQEMIAPIMGLKGNAIVSHIRTGRRKSLSQESYDALMAWTP